MEETFYCHFCGHRHRKESKAGNKCWERLNGTSICYTCFYYQFGRCRYNLIESVKRTGSTTRLKYKCEHHKPRVK